MSQLIKDLKSCIETAKLAGPPWGKHTQMVITAEHAARILAVVEAAEAVLDEADPRKYGDMTAKQSDLADKLVALHENSATE